MVIVTTISCEKTDLEGHLEQVRTSYNYPELYTEKASYIADLYLVYQGTFSSIEYNKEHFKPYVYNINEDGGFQWLYDGFLFMELNTPEGRHFGRDATKEDWKWLLNRHFANDVGITALNNLLLDLNKMNLTPLRKRKVVICIPGPQEAALNWGEVGGKVLDFTKSEDRIISVKWFIDETMERWKKAGYTELDFAGFYWLHEGEGSNMADQHILPKIADYIHSNGLNFFWIPYFGAPMGRYWKDYGFDIAYQQPNYFFLQDSDASPSRLDDACQFASRFNMGMEFECNFKLFNNEIYRRRFDEYLDYFEKHRVVETSPIAYYDDRGALFSMSVSNIEEIKKLYLRISNIVAERQVRVDDIYNRLHQ